MQALRERLAALRAAGPSQRLLALLRRLDPAPRPTPLSPTFLVCFVVLAGVTVWLLATNKYLPGQDYAYHAHCSRVWVDAGRAGTAYAGYEAGQPFDANVLMYSVASLLSHVFRSSFAAFRFVQAYYFIGLPVACLYALRSLDRSPWGSLLAFPLCYSEIFAVGYANMGFAAPTFIFALVEYRRFSRDLSWRRGIAVALLFIAVFLSHAHVYLWLGALVVLYTLVDLVVGFVRAPSARAGLRRTLIFAGGAAAVAAPSLAIFAKWYVRGYGSGRTVGNTGNAGFQATSTWLPLQQKYMAGALQAFASTTNKYEVLYLLALGLLVTLVLVLARAARDRSAPLFELAILLSVISYFLLPDDIAGQMVAVRQWYFVLWMLPIIVVPVALRIGRVRALAAIAGILVWTTWRMTLVGDYLRRFTKEEMGGFEQIVAAGPPTPGLTVAYVSVNPRSQYWVTSSMYHSYGYMDSQRDYDGPIEYSDERSVVPVRYTKGPPHPVKHLYGNANWAADPVIWQYDLILVHRWAPNPSQEKAAKDHGMLVAASGNWQLWRRNP